MAVAKATTLPHTGGSLSPTTPHVASSAPSSRRSVYVRSARPRRLLAGTPGISHRRFGRTADYVLSAWFLAGFPTPLPMG